MDNLSQNSMEVSSTTSTQSGDDSFIRQLWSKWEYGDWEFLKNIDFGTVENDCDCAIITILSAAGYSQHGNFDIASDLFRFAAKSEASKTTIAQVIISGVYNSLGRAAAALYQSDRAVKNFETAVKFIAASSDLSFDAQHRVEKQFQDLGFQANDLPKILYGKFNKINASNHVSAGDVDSIRRMIQDVIVSQRHEIQNMKGALYYFMKNELKNMTRQIESFSTIMNCLGSVSLPLNFHAWAISPDFGLEILKRLSSKKYDLVLEFGSGSSTYIIAKYLKNSCGTKFTSFDHLENYYTSTRKILASDSLEDVVDLTLAPLQEYHGPDHGTYLFYDCTEKLKMLARSSECIGGKILVIIDGPPEDTCKNARYPAIPIILSCFSGNEIDFLLDDYIRTDEKVTARKWENYIASNGLTYKTEEIILEKEACFISVGQ